MYIEILVDNEIEAVEFKETSIQFVMNELKLEGEFCIVCVADLWLINIDGSPCMERMWNFEVNWALKLTTKIKAQKEAFKLQSESQEFVIFKEILMKS